MGTAAPRKRWVLLAMALALMMTMIDASIVAVALPTIQRDLGLTNTGRVWIVNAYLLVFTASIAAAGRFADRLGQRSVFLLGLVVFTLASVGAGVAPTGTTLVAARAVAGLGGALMTPTSQAIVTAAFARQERGRALGIYAGVSAVGVAIGPLLGGALTTFADWPWIFFVNVPVGVAVLALTRYAHPAQSRAPDAPPVDWLGLGTLVTGMAALVIALMQGNTWGMTSPAFLGTLGAGLVLLGTFGAVELRRRHPLLQLRIFGDRDFLSDSVVMFCLRFALFGMAVYLPVFVQDVLGFSAFEAGAATMPMTVMLLLVSPRAGKAYDRVGARVLMAGGAAATALGLGWLIVTLPFLSYPWMIPAYVVVGVGVGVAQTPSLTDGMNAARAGEQGEAAGLLGTVQQLGGTVGTAVMTALLTPLFIDRLSDATGVSTTEAQTALNASEGGTKARPDVPPGWISAGKEAFAHALSVAFVSAVVLMGVAVAVALTVHSRRRTGGGNPRKPPEPAARTGQPGAGSGSGPA